MEMRVFKFRIHESEISYEPSNDSALP